MAQSLLHPLVAPRVETPKVAAVRQSRGKLHAALALTGALVFSASAVGVGVIQAKEGAEADHMLSRALDQGCVPAEQVRAIEDGLALTSEEERRMKMEALHELSYCGLPPEHSTQPLGRP